MSPLNSSGARYRVIIYILIAVIFLSVFTVVASVVALRIQVNIPDVVIGIVNMSIGALIAWGGSVIKSFELGREELQTARIENEKECK